MFRLSLRELLVLVGAIALAIVSLRSASPFLQSIVGVFATLMAIAMLMAAIFDRAMRQAFAIGFAVVMFGYIAIVWHGSRLQMGADFQNAELMEYPAAVLPTSCFLQWLHARLERSAYVYTDTGKEVPASEQGKVAAMSGPLGSSGGNYTLGGRQVAPQQLPPSVNFMLTGHYWWAMLFGYIGGRFARLCYLRRTKERTTTA